MPSPLIAKTFPCPVASIHENRSYQLLYRQFGRKDESAATIRFSNYHRTYSDFGIDSTGDLEMEKMPRAPAGCPG
jgi:hypothetical protein